MCTDSCTHRILTRPQTHAKYIEDGTRILIYIEEFFQFPASNSDITRIIKNIEDNGSCRAGPIS